MATSSVEVSSAILTELQNDLTSLKESLHDIYDLMNYDLSQIGETWRDQQYSDFKNAHQKNINECENISIRYEEWCKTKIEPLIQSVEDIEKTSVVDDDGRGGTSSGGASGGDRKVVERPKTTTKPEPSTPPTRQRPNISGSASGRQSPRGNSSQNNPRVSPIQRPPKHGGNARNI